MGKLQIVYLPPGDLKPYEKNARKHAPDDIQAIKKSILEDGFNDPIGIWGEDNVIVEGHGRQIAALDMGLEKVSCKQCRYDTGRCEDCLFVNSKDCPEYKESEDDG